MSRVIRKRIFAYTKTKTQISCAVTAALFRYSDSTIPPLPLPKMQDSNFLLRLYRPVCDRLGRKPRRPVFSRRGSNYNSLDCLLHVLIARDEMRKHHFIDKINDNTSKTMKNANCDVNVGAKGKIANSLHVGYVTST